MRSAKAPGLALAEVEMPRRYWLIKSEPFKYAWEELVADGSTCWDGVRNHEARNNLGEMKLGDLCLYYHSSKGKEVVGVARVCRESYPDPTAEDPRWLVVDVEPVVSVGRPVTLQEIKSEPALRNINLIRRSRLSVVPIERAEFDLILKLGETKLPRHRRMPVPAQRGRI
jgi:predicted RNA-binding protein with PUA-like domain